MKWRTWSHVTPPEVLWGLARPSADTKMPRHGARSRAGSREHVEPLRLGRSDQFQRRGLQGRGQRGEAAAAAAAAARGQQGGVGGGARSRSTRSCRPTRRPSRRRLRRRRSSGTGSARSMPTRPSSSARCGARPRRACARFVSASAGAAPSATLRLPTARRLPMTRPTLTSGRRAASGRGLRARGTSRAYGEEGQRRRGEGTPTPKAPRSRQRRAGRRP